VLGVVWPPKFLTGLLWTVLYVLLYPQKTKYSNTREYEKQCNHTSSPLADLTRSLYVRIFVVWPHSFLSLSNKKRTWSFNFVFQVTKFPVPHFLVQHFVVPHMLKQTKCWKSFENQWSCEMRKSSYRILKVGFRDMSDPWLSTKTTSEWVSEWVCMPV